MKTAVGTDDGMGSFKATHYIAMQHLVEWLDDHDINVHDVESATVEIGRPNNRDQVSAWLEVKIVKRDVQGDRYAGPDGHCAATGIVTVPLKSFPRLISG